MKRSIKTLLVVLLLTALIWAWAEESQTRTLDKQAIELTIDVPPGTGFAVLNADQWGHRLKLPVTVDFRGQQGGISRLDQMITRGEYPPVHSLHIDEKLRNLDDDTVHTIELNLVRILNDQPILGRLHSNVIAATGGGEVKIARLKKYRLPIEVHSSQGRTVLKNAHAEVLLPGPLYQALLRDDRARVQAEVAPGPSPSGREIAVLAQQIAGFPIRPLPSRVTVERDGTLEKYRLLNVQVKEVYSGGFPRHEYELDSAPHQWRKTVVIEGPAGRTVTAADVDLQLRFDTDDTETHRSATGLVRNVEVALPPGFELVRIEPEPTIQFRFERKKP